MGPHGLPCITIGICKKRMLNRESKEGFTKFISFEMADALIN
jgi:hypothetical protein